MELNFIISLLHYFITKQKKEAIFIVSFLRVEDGTRTHDKSEPLLYLIVNPLYLFNFEFSELLLPDSCRCFIVKKLFVYYFFIDFKHIPFTKQQPLFIKMRNTIFQTCNCLINFFKIFMYSLYWLNKFLSKIFFG